MRITVIGSGYVGLVSAVCFAELGHEVLSVDNDHAKIALLRKGQVPIHERFLPELLDRHRGKRLSFSTSVREAVDQSDAVFITVGNSTIRNRRGRLILCRGSGPGNRIRH